MDIETEAIVYEPFEENDKQVERVWLGISWEIVKKLKLMGWQ